MSKFAPLLAIAVGLPLSGCQSFPLFHFAAAQPVRSADSPTHGATSYVAAGRQQLQSGQVGSAIDSFRVALAVGEDPGAALNGLGVAYAHLGRPDTAEALFRRAAELEPGNESYARNLARLEASGEAVASAPTGPQASPPVTAVAEPEIAPGQFARISPWEVKIQTARVRPGTAPLPAVASRTAHEVQTDKSGISDELHGQAEAHPSVVRVAQVDPRFKPLVRVQLDAPKATPAPEKATHPSNVALKTPVDSGFVSLVRFRLDDIGEARSGKRKIITIAQR